MQADTRKGHGEEVGPILPAVHVHRLFDTVDAMRDAVKANWRLAPHLPHVHQHVGHARHMIRMKMRQDDVLQFVIINAEVPNFVQRIGTGIDQNRTVFFADEQKMRVVMLGVVNRACRTQNDYARHKVAFRLPDETSSSISNLEARKFDDGTIT